MSDLFRCWKEPGEKEAARRPHIIGWCLFYGSGVLDWEKLKYWRAVCQQNADNKDQPKEDRKMWQRRLKAAKIICDHVWPRDGVKPLPLNNYPVELEDELKMAITMGHI